MARKRFTRYWQDPQFRTVVDQQFAVASAEARKGGWITYAIYDAARPDPSGEYSGLILYVGQTKDFGKRVRKRMRDAGTAVDRPSDRIDGALYDLMRKGGVPRFLVLDRAADAVGSFVSETNWAKALREKGHPLLNQWTEQKFGGRAIERHTIKHDWLWRLAVEDAVEAMVDLIVRNRRTGEEVVLDLSMFRPKELLRKVRAAVLERAQLSGEFATVRLYVR